MIYSHDLAEALKPKALTRKPMPVQSQTEQWQLEKYLDSRGLNPKLARENGWYVSSKAGDHAVRVVIPATSRVDGHIFWQARAVDKCVDKRYQSPHGSRLDALVIMYPENFFDKAVICEGPLDALAAADEGVLGIGLMGATPSQVVLDHLAERVQGLSVVIACDIDALDKGVAVLVALQERGVNRIVVAAPSAPYKDLAETPKGQRQWINKIW